MLLAKHQCSKDGDPDLLPEFEFVTVNRGRASAYMRDMEPTLEQMARSLVESGDYRVRSRLSTGHPKCTAVLWRKRHQAATFEAK